MIGRRQVLLAVAAVSVWPAAAPARAYRPPRTRSGAPDLQGLWSNASYTRLERPRELGTLVVSPDVARAYEAKLARMGGVPPPPGDDVGQVQSEFVETGSGLARIRGEIRTSWLVDPPDGRLPYTAEAIKALRLDQKPDQGQFDHVEQRPTIERCLTAYSAAAPIMSTPDANVFQFIQTPDHFAIVSEKNHDVRIIPLKPGPRTPPQIRPWMGDSRGRWDAETLVVETADFHPLSTQRGARVHVSADARVVERFTRIAADEILYGFTVDDPKLYSQRWRGEMLFKATKGPLYEFACHEGNYSLPHILAGARQAEKAGVAASATAR